MIKSPLCFILPIVYIIHRSEFIKMPNCVDFRASLCSIKWLMTVCFEAKQSCLEKVFLKLTQKVSLGVIRGEVGFPRKRSGIERPRGWRKQWGGLTDLDLKWRGKESRAGLERGDPGRGPVGPAFWVMSTHTTECKEVIYCYIFNNSKRLKRIFMFYQSGSG